MKQYESPFVEKNIFTTSNELMNNVPTVSDNGYGWDEDGPGRSKE